MEHLQSFIQDCDARTEIAKKRLKETQEELSEEANSKVGSLHSWTKYFTTHPGIKTNHFDSGVETDKKLNILH